MPPSLATSWLERRLPAAIFACQLISIVSAVVLVYVGFIVLKPGHLTLQAQFDPEAAVCTTLKMNISNVSCSKPSCVEYCLSKGGVGCKLVWAKVRKRGSDVLLQGCQLKAVTCSHRERADLEAFFCAAEVSGPTRKAREKGQCSRLQGRMHCEPAIWDMPTGRGPKAVHTSRCLNITSLESCRGRSVMGATSKPCDVYRCNDYNGIYDCQGGVCRHILEPRCVNSCSDLQMGNISIVTSEKFYYGSCQSASVENTSAWCEGGMPLLAYCTRLVGNGTSFRGEDCLNGTLVPDDRWGNLTTYQQIMLTLQQHQPALAWSSLPSETSLQLNNFTQAMINIGGCVNTLRKECTGWMTEHGRDGRDGRHPSVYPCYVTANSDEYVITNFDRQVRIGNMDLLSMF